MPALPSSLTSLLSDAPAGACVPDSVAELPEALAAVPDPHARRGVRYRSTVVLTAAVYAVLAGGRSYTAIAEWIADLPDQTGSRRAIAVGGKTVRGSHTTTPARHVLAAAGQQTGVVLGQHRRPRQGQRDRITYLAGRHAHWILTVKANQPGLHAQLAAYPGELPLRPRQHPPPALLGLTRRLCRHPAVLPGCAVDDGVVAVASGTRSTRSRDHGRPGRASAIVFPPRSAVSCNPVNRKIHSGRSC